jgi:hypothetical protein
MKLAQVTLTETEAMKVMSSKLSESQDGLEAIREQCDLHKSGFDYKLAIERVKQQRLQLERIIYIICELYEDELDEDEGE